MGLPHWSISRWLDSLKQMPMLGGSTDYFQIDLSSRYRPVMAPIRMVLVGSCVLLLLAICWSVAQAVVGYQAARSIAAELERVLEQDRQLVAEARNEGIDLSAEAMQRLPAEVELANQLLEKRMFSWTNFLAGLEQAIPPQLALSSVRLESGGTVVHLSGTAMNLESITALTVGLQDHPTFKDPVLAQHRVGQNGLVEFNVTVRYRREGA